jgi:hypothetical protein
MAAASTQLDGSPMAASKKRPSLILKVVHQLSISYVPLCITVLGPSPAVHTCI